MELYIHYQQLPQGKELADVVGRAEREGWGG